MAGNKELKKEQLEKVVGGSNNVSENTDIKCSITYKYLGVEKTEEVVLKVTDENDVLEAVHDWCDNHSYEYVSHSIICGYDARYRF